MEEKAMGFGLDSMGKKGLNNRQVICKKLSESTKRLASGYRVNSSADDPAGLAVSEKLRSIDRGLRQGVRNISDGLNYIDTVDSASQQVHNMLHRLKEIAVEAANGTNQRLDRESLDLEYQQILDEIGQIADNSNFNGLPLFEPHQPTFTTFEGSVVHNTPITIDSTKTPLYVNYSINGAYKEISIHIPYGTYTADEVADMIDDFLIEREPNLIIGVDEHNHFTIQSENGHISSISGPGASLFYDTTIGSADGYLLGVTVFAPDDADGSLPIFEGINDTMKFRLGNADDTVYTIVLPPRPDEDPYTRPELLDEINGQLEALGISDMVKAIPYVNEDGKNIIGFSSKKPVTGLGGNFLLLDSFSSPLYDIAKHCTAENTNATLDGAQDVNGLEILRGRNDWFDLKVSYYVGDEQSVVRNDLKITLLGEDEDQKTYASASEVADEIQRQLSEKGVPVKVIAKPDGTLGFTSDQYGDKCYVKVDTVNVPSGYMLKDIFDYGELLPLTGRADSSYYPAYLSGKRDISGGVEIGESSKRLTYNIRTDSGSVSLDFDIDPGKYSQSQIKSILESKLNDLINNTHPELKGSLEFEIGKNITLKATDNEAGKHITDIGVQSSGAYRQLIGGATYSDNSARVEGTEMASVIYLPSSPTGGQNIVEVPGQSNAENVSYYSGSNSSTPGVKDGTYITYSNVSPILKKGEGGRIEGDPTHFIDAKPATMKISNVRSLFADDGKLAEDATLTFNVDGRPCNITLKKGTKDTDAVSIINSQIKGATVEWGSANNPNNPNSNDLMFTSDAQKPTVEFTNVSGTLLRNANIAAGAKRDGAVIDVDKNTYSVPPSLTLGSVKSHMPLTVNGLNDNFVLNVGGKEAANITIPNGTYNDAGSLASAINGALSGSGFSVKADGDNIVITGDLNMSGSITVGGNSHLNDRKYVSSGGGDRAGSLTVNGVGTNLPATFPDGKYIQFTYSDGEDPSKSQTYQVDLGGKSFSSMSSLVQEIRNQVGTDKVSVSYSGDRLTITTVGKGSGYAVTGFTTNTTLNQTKIDNTKTPNSVVVGDRVLTYGRLENSMFSGLFNTGGGLEITDSNDTFEVVINGSNRVNVKLTHGLYTSSEGILSQIRSAVSAAGGKVNVVSGKLVISTADGGNGKKVEIGSGNTSPLFKRAFAVGDPSRAGLRSYPAYIMGTQPISTVEIGTYNNEMSFMFSANGSALTKLSISIPPPGDDGSTDPITYDINGLKNALQEAIDGKIGSGILRVTTVGSQLRIESAQITNECSIYDFEGNLFDKIFRKPQYAAVQNHLEKVGTTKGDNLTFIIGRNPMEPTTQEELEAEKNVAIYAGLNDLFAFDFTYRDKTATIDVRIDQGVYTRDELAEHLQTIIRKRIDEMGYIEEDGDPLDSERFRVTIGAQNLQLTSAEGNEVSVKHIDKLLVLSFKEYADGTIEKSDALIEGIRGTSAYKIFYEATKSPSPARIIGSVDLSRGVTITGENNTITLMLNNELISATLPSGTWSGEQISNMLNNIYEDKGTVLRSFISNGRLMFYTLDEGDYKIDKISGNAAQTLFYGGDSREDDTELGIHTGRRTDSYVWLKKVRCDQHLMRINTTGVTTVERALKAIARLDGANAYLTEYRALSGAYENRLEMTRERNTIQIENLENSESAIRDADMAEEVANARKAQIVKQIQEFVITQDQETAKKSIMDMLG